MFLFNNTHCKKRIKRSFFTQSYITEINVQKKQHTHKWQVGNAIIQADIQNRRILHLSAWHTIRKAMSMSLHNEQNWSMFVQSAPRPTDWDRCSYFILTGWNQCNDFLTRRHKDVPTTKLDKYHICTETYKLSFSKQSHLAHQNNNRQQSDKNF